MSGSRSESGKLVFQHLISVWSGVADIERLLFGISSGELDDKHEEFSEDFNVQENNNNGHVDNKQDKSVSEPDVDTGNSLQTSLPVNPTKRKSDASVVPRLIDNKGKHSKENLLAAQKDHVFMKKMKNDADFRIYLQIVRKSNYCFSNSVKEISKSMSDLNKGLYVSVKLLSRTIISQPQPQFLQSRFYQNFIYQNLKIYFSTASQKQGYYAQVLGESSESQNP